MNSPVSSLHGRPDKTANTCVLRIPRMAHDRHVYFVRLLQEALSCIGRPTRIELIDGLDQATMWQMLARDELDVLWGGRTIERDKRFMRVDNRITNGISCMRVLLTRRGMEDSFAGVDTIDELRSLGKVAGVGEGWFERELWQAHALPLYVHPGNLDGMFDLLIAADSRLDYITRTPYESIIDTRCMPDLAIVPRLLIVHNRDVRFYLGPAAAPLQRLLEQALQTAEVSGLKKRLIAELLMPPLASLELPRRHRLRLELD